MKDVGTIGELNLKAGDTVECLTVVRNGCWTVGNTYTMADNGLLCDSSVPQRSSISTFRVMSRAASSVKEVGTLEEIGAQERDVVSNGGGYEYTLGVNHRGVFIDIADRCELMSDAPVWNIVCRAEESTTKHMGTLHILRVAEGDVVEHVKSGQRYEIKRRDNGTLWMWNMEAELFGIPVSDSTETYTIITRGSKAPVREVVCNKIVPGVYGRVRVVGTYGGGKEVLLEFPNSGACNKTDLSATIATLTEIRDALV